MSTAQAMPQGAVAGSTNVIDLSIAGRSIGSGEPIGLLLLVTTAITVGTSLMVDLRSTNQDTGVPTTDLAVSPMIHWSSGVVTAAQYPAAGWGTAGQFMWLVLPPVIIPSLQSTTTWSANPYKRYLGMFYTGVSTVAGAFTAKICRAVDMRQYGSAGYTA
jgi:hypothetical protein